MEAIFQFVDEVVEAQRDTYCAIADDIWDHPETRFEEFWSAQRLADALEAEGFQLTRDAGGIPNAFIASVGEGQPPRHSPRRSPPKAGCSSTATAALCASTVVPARKAVREKPLWCAKGCLMMSMRR